MSDPIVSGSRLQLSYNLYYTGPCDKQSASSIMAQHGNFRKSLANLRKLWQKSEAPSLLVYVLDEKYNDLKLSALGQDDQHRAEFLKKHCAEEKFCLYLVEMDTRVETDETRMLELKQIVDLDGADLMCDVELDEEGLIQSDYVESRDSFEGETYCNCGDFDECECERHFEDTVFLLMPEEYRVDFLIENTPRTDIKPWISWISRLLAELNPGPEASNENAAMPDMKAKRSELARLCSHILKNVFALRQNNPKISWSSVGVECQNHPDSQLVLESVAQAGLLLKDKPLFEHAISMNPLKLPCSFYCSLGSNLRTADFGWHREGLDRAVDQIHSIIDRYNLLHSITSGLDGDGHVKPNDAVLKEWSHNKMQELLDRTYSVDERDARLLVDLGEQYGVNFLNTTVYPLAMRNAHNIMFTAEFIACISNAQADKRIGRENAVIGIQNLLATMIPALTLGSGQRPAKRRKFDYPAARESDPHREGRWPFQSDQIVKVFKHCLSLGLENEMNELTARLKQEAVEVDAMALEQVLMPFLTSMAGVMREHKISRKTENYQDLYRTIISLYILRYVSREPEKPLNWSFPARGCGRCNDCSTLDLFLSSLSRQTAEFTTTGPKRDHIKDRISNLRGIRASKRKNAWAPHTLILTKTMDEWQSSCDAWSRRYSSAFSTIKNIGIDNLRRLLGEQFDELVSMRQVKRAVQAVAAPLIAGPQSNIIDLEDA